MLPINRVAEEEGREAGGRRKGFRPAKLIAMAALLPMMALATPQAQASFIEIGDVTTGVTGGLLASGFTLLTTAWDPGVNTARVMGAAAPGGATWSIMGPFIADTIPIELPGSHAPLTAGIGALGVAGVGGIVDAALDIWATVSGFSNLGPVADGGGAPGTAGATGDLGDIRVAAWDIIAPAGVLAHAFNPCTTLLCGPGGNVGGDMHIDVLGRIWADDATDTTADPDFDLFTVILHELGHSLGLGHSAALGSVMEPTYAGARRSLHADDIAGIQRIYGPAPVVGVPEPAALGLLMVGLFGLGMSRRRRSLNRS